MINHRNVNVNLTEENVTQIKSGIMINADANVKYIIYEKSYTWNLVTSSCLNGK